MGIMRGRSGNAVILSGTKDKEKVSYCEECLKVKTLSPLKHRIYLDEHGKITNPAPDADKFLQCWNCGLIVGVYEAKQEPELASLVKPGKRRGVIALVGEDRKFDKTGKTQHKRKFKQDLEQYKEEDVKEALRKGKKLLNYHES